MKSPQEPRYRVPDDVAWIDGTEIGLGEELYLTRLPTGDTTQLAGSARMIWHAAISVTSPVARVASLTGSPPPAISGFVASFLEDLVSERLLTQSQSANSARR